jgi:hypothetical protein
MIGRMVLGVLLLGCGAPDIIVPTYPHPDFASVEPVAFPPPPAQIENLEGTPPAPGCLWVDGQWVWTAQRWEWRPGGWVRPPEGCHYSAPTAHWAAAQGAGVLYYRPGRWYSTTEPKLCPDPGNCPSPSPPKRD